MTCGLKLIRYGVTFNPRYYIGLTVHSNFIGIIYGSIPNWKGFTYNPKLKWWNRYRIKTFRNILDV